ncbi:mitogen-activated protein kinase isoform X2 [Ciona intestinalis]
MFCRVKVLFFAEQYIQSSLFPLLLARNTIQHTLEYYSIYCCHKNMQDDAAVIDGQSDEEHKLKASESQACDTRLITVDMSDISSRYRDIYPLGCGSRALIFSAIDQQCRRRVAVKKIFVKQCTPSHKLKQLIREIRILRKMDHDNIVRMYHALASSSSRDNSSPVNMASNLSLKNQISFDSVYIGMELMDTDLRNVINHNQLSSNYIKLFTYQLLRGLKYLHSANVIHRDLTPSNVFINTDTLMLKIGDFGISRILDSEYEHSGYLSMTTTSTWYQSPEILLHPRHYNQAADMWAAGCIFAEMLIGKPLFNGSNAMEQINLILKSVAVTRENWLSVTTAVCEDENCCLNKDAYNVRENGGIPSRPLRDFLPTSNHMAVNLLNQLLTFAQTDRVTAIDALMHPYLACYSNPFDEPVCGMPFSLEDELDEMDVTNIKQIIWNETSNLFSVPSNESNIVETSTEDCGLRQSLKGSVCNNDSYKNLLALVQSSTHSNGSNTNRGITISESEARTIACDFDYGVQINDGSINRERMSIDFRPITSNAGCFDPYKWDSRCDSNTQQKQPTSAKEEPAKLGAHDGHHQEVVSDHGYHSSYCSSNLSHGKVHAHALWSLSSPDVSIDHERTSGQRASTPDVGEAPSPSAFEEDHNSDYSRHSPTLSSEERDSDVTTSSRRRHKDDVPRHHQSYGHHYHHHHHHHHGHHHHHKHHSRHGSLSSASGGNTSHQRTSSNEAEPSSARCHQRRCLVNDTVPEVLEEPGSDVSSNDRILPKDAPERKSSSSDSDSKAGRKKTCKMFPKFCKSRVKTTTGTTGGSAPADSGFHEPFDISTPAVELKQRPSTAREGTTIRDGPSYTTPRLRTCSEGNRRNNPALILPKWKQLLETTADKSSILHCQSLSDFNRIHAYSGGNDVSSSDVTSSDVSLSPPGKCSKPATPNFPRKRVECPF